MLFDLTIGAYSKTSLRIRGGGVRSGWSRPLCATRLLVFSRVFWSSIVGACEWGPQNYPVIHKTRGNIQGVEQCIGHILVSMCLCTWTCNIKCCTDYCRYVQIGNLDNDSMLTIMFQTLATKYNICFYNFGLLLGFWMQHFLIARWLLLLLRWALV